MIVFELACECGCQFEGWFASRQEFMAQQERQQLSCPCCGGGRIKKILSPVARTRGKSLAGAVQQRQAAHQEQQAELLLQRLVRALSDHLSREYEDVGPRLAGEALKMHYGAEEPRRIRGVATAAEEEMLAREGVELLKVPVFSRKEPGSN